MEYVQQRSNLSMLAAAQRGFYPEVGCAFMDLFNIDQTASILSQYQPDIIFCSATMLPWTHLSTLPKPLAEKLYTAQAGPWLPMTLTLLYKLMQAVQQAGVQSQVINGSYPDSVNAVLGKIGLAPTIGIGNLANNIPALKKSVALKLEQPIEAVDIYFYAHHYVSHCISRFGNAGGAPFHLTVFVDGQDKTHLLNLDTVFDLLPTRFKRATGPLQLLTVASAMTVFDAMIQNTGGITHVPGPNGLPGGYPVQVTRKGVEVLLPDNFPLEHAIEVNEAGQRYDGIDHIDHDGTVHFAGKNMAILQDILGYTCTKMPLRDVEERAKELYARFKTLSNEFALHE